MIQLIKGNGILWSFFCRWGLFFFFHDVFFLWPLQTVFSHPCMLPSAGQEAITSLYKCRVICLLTFDLYLAIEWLCSCCYSPSELKPSLLSLFVSLTPYLSYPLRERASQWTLPSQQCLSLSGSFSSISFLCPDIKSWLIGPDCYYRLIILACKQRYLCFQM